MGRAKRPQRVKLIIGMLAKNKKLLGSVEEFFIEDFGEIDYKSPDLLFNHTDYYKKELGHPLKRRFVSFKKFILPENLSNIKLVTNSIEERFSRKKGPSLKRQINIDLRERVFEAVPQRDQLVVDADDHHDHQHDGHPQTNQYPCRGAHVRTPLGLALSFCMRHRLVQPAAAGEAFIQSFLHALQYIEPGTTRKRISTSKVSLACGLNDLASNQPPTAQDS